MAEPFGRQNRVTLCNLDAINTAVGVAGAEPTTDPKTTQIETVSAQPHISKHTTEHIKNTLLEKWIHQKPLRPIQ